jgi:hypothetical protein
MKYADWIPGKIVLTVREVDWVWKDDFNFDEFMRIHSKDGQAHNVETLTPVRFDTAKLCYRKHKTLQLSDVFYSDGDNAEWTVTELPEQIDAILRANWEAERRFFRAGYSFKSMAFEEQSDG